MQQHYLLARINFPEVAKLNPSDEQIQQLVLPGQWIKYMLPLIYSLLLLLTFLLQKTLINSKPLKL